MITRFTPALAICLLSLVLTGCVGTQAETARARLIQQGYSAAYADGFAHGLSSGQSAAGNPYAAFRKDPARFDAESDYKQGYEDGFAQGKGRYDATSRQVNSL